MGAALPPISAALATLAAAAASLLGGLEELPTALSLRIQLRGGLVLKRFVIVKQVEADTIDAMSGVDGGLDLGLTAANSIEKGEADRRIVQSGAIAHLVQGVAEGRVAVLGDVTDAIWRVAGTIGDGIPTGQGPDLSIAMEPPGSTNASQVASGIVHGQAGDGRDVARRSEGDQGL